MLLWCSFPHVCQLRLVMWSRGVKMYILALSEDKVHWTKHCERKRRHSAWRFLIRWQARFSMCFLWGYCHDISVGPFRRRACHLDWISLLCCTWKLFIAHTYTGCPSNLVISRVERFFCLPPLMSSAGWWRHFCFIWHTPKVAGPPLLFWCHRSVCFYWIILYIVLIIQMC